MEQSKRKRSKLPPASWRRVWETLAEATKCPLVFKWTLQAPVFDGFQAALAVGWSAAAKFQGSRSPMRLTG
jgi:hypothetical protein